MPSPAIPLFPAQSSQGDFFRGLALPFKALKLILRTKALRRLSLWCAVVTCLSLIGVGIASWSLGQRGAQALVQADTGWQHAASLGLGIVFFGVLFIIGALTAPNLLLAPLQDPLSEATEARCGDFVSPPFSVRALWRGVAVSMLHTLTRTAIMVTGLLALLLLNLLPVAGNGLCLVLSSLWSAIWLAAEHLSNPMARHFRPFREVSQILRRRLPLTVGFGAALSVLLWVPVLNCFLMPVAVVAGTLLYRGLVECGAIAPKKPEEQGRPSHLGR